MHSGGISKKEQNAWIMAAAIIPAAAAAAKVSWLSVLAASALCYGVSKGAVNTEPGKWLGKAKAAAMLLLLCASLPDAAACWPGKYAEIAVPTALLVMAAVASIKGMETAARSSNVLRYGAMLFLAAVLLVGSREIEKENLAIGWHMPQCALFSALLIPAIGGTEEKGKQIGKLSMISLGSSIIVGGVMGRKADLYEFSKSISLLGASERMESLMAASMTVGYYALVSLLLSLIAKEWADGKRKREKESLIGASLLAEASFWMEWNRKSCIIPILIVILWTVVPAVATIKSIWKK